MYESYGPDDLFEAEQRVWITWSEMTLFEFVRHLDQWLIDGMDWMEQSHKEGVVVTLHEALQQCKTSIGEARAAELVDEKTL